MRSKFYLSAFFIISLLVSCKEDEQPNPNVVQISGNTYTTARIGSKTWTIENYDGSGGITYDASNSKPEYGKYYTYDELKAIVLPDGWRIPTLEDYSTLAEANGITITNQFAISEDIKALTSTTNWKNIQGTNTSGFNAHPAGYSFNNSAPIDGDIAEFWADNQITFSLQEGADKVRMRLLFYDSSNSPLYRFNVRFVRDN
jgi:uncharacterized protein (TIGR02145 family)